MKLMQVDLDDLHSSAFTEADFSKYDIVRMATRERNSLLAGLQKRIHEEVLDVIRRDDDVR